MSSEQIPPRPDALHPTVSLTSTRQAPRGLAALPRVTWSWWEALGVYLLAFFLAGFATLPVFRLFDSEDLATMVASFVAALTIVGVLVFWLQKAHRGWQRAIGFRVPNGGEAAGIVGSGILLYLAVVFVIGSILAILISAVAGESVRAPEQVPSGLSAFGVVVTLVYGVVIAPIGEEFFFRGVFFRAVRDRHGFWPGALASGLVFGPIHYIPGPAPSAILLMSAMVFTGMGLAWIYERRGTILAPILAHMTFNVIGLVLIYTLR